MGGPRRLFGRAFLAALGGWLAAAAGCAIGPRALHNERLCYNEAVKVTAEQQLLLNIVRLRYTDTPSSLAVTTIAAQHELQQSFKLIPFLSAAGSDVQIRGFKAVLPQAELSGADRPTISLTPQDDQEFTRRLFTPVSLEGIVYLSKTTWPISTVFRLWLETLNRVDNAQTASGPTPAAPPDFADFRRGIAALQTLQDRNLVHFFLVEKEEKLGDPVPAADVTPRDVLEAARSNYEYRKDEKGQTWTLVRKKQQPVLRIHPGATASPEALEFTRTFRLRPGLTQYDLAVEKLDPFPVNYPPGGVDTLDLEPRSLLQVLYFVSQGVDVPPEHMAEGLVTVTAGPGGEPFDWQLVLGKLFRVCSAAGKKPPPNAHVAVCYKGYWFYIEETDQDTKSTFSLLMEISRLELAEKTGTPPILTLPLTGR